ncbi:MAG: SDR family oxidoreductase [Nitrospirae bacterium]|nr:SDR family oxidoreductase [Nitrospirota bacterium]
MTLKGKNVIITGASGGIGSYTAMAFAKSGSNVCLIDKNADRLEKLSLEIARHSVKSAAIAADITTDNGINVVLNDSKTKLGNIDVLVNCAGIMPFKLIVDHSGDEVMKTLLVNIYGTIRLTQKVLPDMITQRRGRIVNIGSIFGSISFPLFGIYSASKFAVRGFSEALRRELMGTGVGVTYVAPRATRTSQKPLFFEMAGRTKMHLDKPESVASVIVGAVEKEKDEVYIGAPERFFVLINKLLPQVVDKALKKNMQIMSEYVGKV